MRLIDADTLKTDYIVPSTSTGTVSTQYVSLFQILNAPTIDSDQKRIEYLQKLVDINAERCDELCKQLREAHESYEKHLNEMEALQKYQNSDAVEVKHGEWINVSDEDWAGGGKTECSNCNYGYAWGAYSDVEDFKYCPHCGAKMDGEVKNDE